MADENFVWPPEFEVLGMLEKAKQHVAEMYTETEE